MAFTPATGSRTSLYIVTESTYGTTPTTPSMALLPANYGSAPTLTKTLLRSDEIRGDRQSPTLRHGMKQAEMKIDCEFRATDFDTLMESTFMSAFSANTISVGSTLKSFSILEYAADISKYRVLTGATVNGFSLDIGVDAMIKASFDMYAQNLGAYTSGAPTASGGLQATLGTSSGKEPFDGYTATFGLNIGGSVDAQITTIKLNIANNLERANVIGANTTQKMITGDVGVTGQFMAYLEDGTIDNAFIDESEGAITIAMTDGTSTYTFTLYRVKFNSSAISLERGARMITCDYEAIYSNVTAESNTIKLVKS